MFYHYLLPTKYNLRQYNLSTCNLKLLKYKIGFFEILITLPRAKCLQGLLNNSKIKQTFYILNSSLLEVGFENDQNQDYKLINLVIEVI